MMTTMAALLGALPLALGARRRRRAAPAARHRHRRRPDLQPDADALHDAGHLSLHGTLPALFFPPAPSQAAAARGMNQCRIATMKSQPRQQTLVTNTRKNIFTWRFPPRLLLISACSVGPDYVRPALETPAAYKETEAAKNSQSVDDVVSSKLVGDLRRPRAQFFGTASRDLEPKRRRKPKRNFAKPARWCKPRAPPIFRP